MKNSTLWNKLERFQLDDPSAGLTFTRRLARENGWSIDYAERVVMEYKRFIFLCAEAGHPVTPSDEVDQVWHLHLCYTKSYWKEMCGEIIGREIHHGPTKGGQAEDAKFQDWYEETKQSYKRLFAEAPPTDIWPVSEKRFARDQDFGRVNRSDYWMIHKPSRSAKIAAAFIPAILAVAGCTIDDVDRIEISPESLIFILIGIFVILLLWSKIGGGGGGNSSGQGGFFFHGDFDDDDDHSGCGSGCGDD